MARYYSVLVVAVAMMAMHGLVVCEQHEAYSCCEETVSGAECVYDESVFGLVDDADYDANTFEFGDRYVSDDSRIRFISRQMEFYLVDSTTYTPEIQDDVYEFLKCFNTDAIATIYSWFLHDMDNVFLGKPTPFPACVADSYDVCLWMSTHLVDGMLKKHDTLLYIITCNYVIQPVLDHIIHA